MIAKIIKRKETEEILFYLSSFLLENGRRKLVW